MPEAFNYLSGLVEWNSNFGNFPYYFDAGRRRRHFQWHRPDPGGSPGVVLLAHRQAKYLDQNNAYMTMGINGGETPYGEFSQWQGQFEGRYYLYARNTARSDSTPPPAIADLTAVTGNGVTTLAWTAPADAERYHVVWSTKPIVEANSTNPAVINWWAATAVGPDLRPSPGARQTLTIDTGSASPVYAADLFVRCARQHERHVQRGPGCPRLLHPAGWRLGCAVHGPRRCALSRQRRGPTLRLGSSLPRLAARRDAAHRGR